jgi:ABC-type branched-subunit amino acid transport system substrate-binding protein
MMKNRAAKILAGLLALGLIAAACGDDGNKATSTSSTGGSTATGSAPATGSAAATGCTAGAATLKIGGLAQAQNFAGMDEGIKAVVEKVNKTCIGGRKLEFVGLKDDGSDPAKNLSLAQSLVEQDKVFAIIATSAVLLPATTTYLASKKVPFFGWGFMPGFCSSKTGAADSWGYGFNGCLSAFALGLSKKTNGSLIAPIATVVKKDADKLTLVTFSSDDDAGTFGDLQYNALFTKAQVVGHARVPVQGAGDYTQFVNLVKDKKPDAVMISTDFVSGIKMKGALKAAGYAGVIYDYVTYIPGLLDSSKDTAAALEGGYSESQFPANEDNTAAIKQIQADLTASGSKLPFATQGASIGYWSTELLRQMLVAVAAKGDITPDNFRKVIEGGFTSTPVDGGLGAITFPAGHEENVPCSGLVQVKDAKYISAVPFKCYTLLDAKTS